MFRYQKEQYYKERSGAVVSKGMQILNGDRWDLLQRRQVVRLLSALFLILSGSACTHKLMLDSVPSDSMVYLLDEQGTRSKLLGRTPLATEELSSLQGAGVMVVSPGHIPLTVVVPFQGASVSKINVRLTPYDEKFIEALPFELHKKVTDQLAGELIDLQQSLYGGSQDEAESAILESAKRLGLSSRYHQIVGSFRFYQGQFEAAVRSLSKALELDPNNETARRMLVLTDVKVANSSQAARNRAYANLNQAATEIVRLGQGYLVRTKSTPQQVDYDGMEIVIPTDVLFKPYSGKFKQEGLVVLAKLSEELRKSNHPKSILVEGHTSGDLFAELRDMPAQSVGATKLQGIWEVSSQRASAVVTYLKSDGVVAAKWSIAGYGDSRPLVLPENTDSAKTRLDPEVLSRRVVIRVTFNPENNEKQIMSEYEAKRLKERINQLMPANEDEAEEPRSQRKTKPSVKRNVSNVDDEKEEASEDETSDTEIPRKLPRQTVLQKRAESVRKDKAMRSRALDSVDAQNAEPQQQRLSPRKSRLKQSKERMKGVEDNPPLPLVPQLRPQD